MKLHSDFNGTKFEVVPISKIVVPEYQRDIKELWVDELAGDWQPRLFHPVTLSLREDGTYAIVDGQHELNAAKRRGHEVIPAVVHVGLSLADEAALFSDLNSMRRKPEAYDLWKSDYIAERPWAVAVTRLANKYSLRPTKGGDGPYNLRAFGAMRTLIQKGQEDILDDALDILTSVYDGEKPYNRSRVERNFIIGMSDLILRAQALGYYDKDAFKKRLSRHTFKVYGTSQRLTPDGFQSYINSLIAAGKIIVPTMNSGSGQGRVYGKALAIAALGAEQAAKVYA